MTVKVHPPLPACRPQTTHWIINHVEAENIPMPALWFCDGNAVMGYHRGGLDVSDRLIVEGLGFLDITTITFRRPLIDFNGAIFLGIGFDSDPPTPVGFSLVIQGDGGFVVAVEERSKAPEDLHQRVTSYISGKLKPLPVILEEDVRYFREKIAEKYVPYPDVPTSPGQTEAEIRVTSARLFPWSRYSFELGMAMYDWTTASFTRMVLMSVFQYTAMPGSPPPLDKRTIAKMIWRSEWETYTPWDADYMRSFLMAPAKSLSDVERQLDKVADELQAFSAIEIRILVAAMQSLPRTCVCSRPVLYSGQVDIQQMGMDRFGVEFLECPGNAGPIGRPLRVELGKALKTFMKPGSRITTKMVWSFTDNMEDALHYSNGLLLVLDAFAGEGFVWDGLSYVTVLSNDPEKKEYTVPPRTSFRVRAVEQRMYEDKPLQVIFLQMVPGREHESKQSCVTDKDIDKDTLTPPQAPLPFLPPPLSDLVTLKKGFTLDDDDFTSGTLSNHSPLRWVSPSIPEFGDNQAVPRVHSSKNGRRCGCPQRTRARKSGWLPSWGEGCTVQ